MSLTNHWPCDAAHVSTTVQDIVGTAHFVPQTGKKLLMATGQVKGLQNRMYLPVVLRGLAGYSAPGVRDSANALVTNITSPGTAFSLSFLLRMNQPIAGTLLRWEGGYSYIYCSATGELQIEGPSAHIVATAAELGVGVWHRLTLIRVGLTTVVYVDTQNVRTVARSINIATGIMDVMSYRSDDGYEGVSPGGYDLCDIRIYDHNLTEAEIAALVTADGTNPTTLSWYNETGSDFGAGCVFAENQLSAGGYVGTTYFDIVNLHDVGNRTKLWTNGESCRYGKSFYVGSKTELYCYAKYYIPSENTMNDGHSSPGPAFSLMQFHLSNLISDTNTNWIAMILAIWEDPGDGGGARLRRYRTTWFNASSVATDVDMADADIPLDREFVVEAHIKMDGANSIIEAWIDGVKVTDIGPGKANTADFTGKANIASVCFFPFNGVHQDLQTETESYAVYIGKQFVGDARYAENGPMNNHFHTFMMNRRIKRING